MEGKRDRHGPVPSNFAGPQPCEAADGLGGGDGTLARPGQVPASAVPQSAERTAAMKSIVAVARTGFGQLRLASTTTPRSSLGRSTT